VHGKKKRLGSTLHFMKGRFDPLLKHPTLTWMRDSFKHRRWPPTGGAILESWGIEALQEICGGIAPVVSVDQLKQDLSGKPFFVLPYR
jgi:hypothetical protein